VEAATEDNVGGDTEKDRKRKEPVHDQGNVRGRAVHWSGPGLLENDEGGGEDGAARAATGTGGGGRGGRQTVAVASLVSFLSSLSSLLCHSFRVFLSLSLALFPSFLPFISRIVGQARRGQGELPRAAGGLLEVAADGEQERTVYNIVMIQ